MVKVYSKRSMISPPADAVYVGRPSIWGNPFTIRDVGSRVGCIDQYRRYVLGNPDMVRLIRENLKGKSLVCHCAPRACHGDVLLEIANDPDPLAGDEDLTGF